MHELINVADELPKGDVQVLAYMDDGKSKWIDVVWFWRSRGFDQHPVKYWVPITAWPSELTGLSPDYSDTTGSQYYGD